MLCPRSIDPESDWSPISAVPPSPANTTTLTSVFPCALRALSTPDATAPAFSKATCIHGTFQAV